MGLIRDALIARAASDLNRPGSLPCPDSHDGDGIADGSVMHQPVYSAGCLGARWTCRICAMPQASGSGTRCRRSFEITPSGRLEQRNHGLPDAERRSHRSSMSRSSCRPGAPLASQNRDPSNTNAAAVRAQYLDGENPESNNDGDTDYVTGVASDTFNDQPAGNHPRRADARCRAARGAAGARMPQAICASDGQRAGRFPFAAPLSDTTTFADASNTYAGRLPRRWSRPRPPAPRSAPLARARRPAGPEPPPTDERCFQAGTGGTTGATCSSTAWHRLTHRTRLHPAAAAA